jgi:hypothetical protein
MPIQTINLKRFIDMTVTTGVDNNAAWLIPVSSLVSGSIQVTNVGDTSWGSGILTITASNDGRTFYALPAWVGTPATISASGIYGPYDFSAVAFIRVVTTTAEATLQVDATFIGKGDA